MSVTVSALTAAMGNGSVATQPVVDIRCTLANTTSNACNFTVEFTIDGGLNWRAATLLSPYLGQNISVGTNRTILIDLLTSFTNLGLADYNGNAQVRIKAVDVVTADDSGFVTSSVFTLKTTKPQVTSATMAAYIGAANASAAAISLASTGSPTLFRASVVAANLNASSTSPAFSAYATSVSFAFPGGQGDGATVVYLRVYDAYYNASDLVNVSTYLQRTPPSHCVVSLRGSVGNTSYTGIAINPDGSFTPDRAVTVQVAGQSPIPLTYTILGGSSSNVEASSSVDTPITYSAENLIKTVNVTTTPSNPTIDNRNADADVSVTVRFADAAGNTTLTSAIIRLNTRIYLTAHKPLKRPDAGYQHIVREVTTGGAEMIIPKTLLLESDPIRNWKDTFYPSSHSYPTNLDGTIDEAAAILMGGENTSSFDAVKLTDVVRNVSGIVTSATIVTDDDGRPVMEDWTIDGSKNYPDMVSSDITNLEYWVVDNTGYGDFRLEFDQFNLDSNIFGPPFNPQAPFKGDLLAIYDATEAGALTLSVDEAGNQRWQLADATKLQIMMAFTGSGTNVIDLITGRRVNADTNGAFIGDYIRGVPKVVMIFYSDASHGGAGFRLKAGQAHDRVWSNYDVDETNGQIWIHKHSSLGSPLGAAGTTTKRAIYYYLDRNVVIDSENQKVIFTANPSGEVRIDASYYDYSGAAPSNVFIASHTDFVDYQDAPVYVLPTGTNALNDAIRNKVYETDGYGRVTGHANWDKDRGVLTWDNGYVPPSGQRQASDYQFHTYLRLASDGHGDLTFRDSVIVADTTPVYPDYTYTDVKIVNEGDALLEQGLIKFVPRGYDRNNDGEIVLTGDGVVDQVLDINRPWDIQQGTKLETYDKMALEIRDNFTWDRSLAKADAQTILQTWKQKTFGSIAPRSRVYGRAVWVLGGTGGSSYPPTTSGSKRTSLELDGKYYATFFA